MPDEAVDAQQSAGTVSSLSLWLQGKVQESRIARHLDVLLSQYEHQASSETRYLFSVILVILIHRRSS